MNNNSTEIDVANWNCHRKKKIWCEPAFGERAKTGDGEEGCFLNQATENLTMVVFLLVIQMGKEAEAQEKCACGWGEWRDMQMNVCYFPECMELHSLRSFFWITRSSLPTQFASYLSTPNCYNCGWRFPVLPLYSVMLKGIWFLFLGSSIASFSVHHITTSMYIWQTMPKSYLPMFPMPHLKKAVLKLPTYSDLHGFCSCAWSSSARWQQWQLQRDFVKILPISTKLLRGESIPWFIINTV